MSPQPRRGAALVLLVLLAPLAGATHDPLDPLHAQATLPDLLPFTNDVDPVDETTAPRICTYVYNVALESLTTPPFYVELRVDGTPVNSTLVSEGLAGGEAVTLCWTLGGPLPRGYHRFTVVADSEEDTPESNETNNVARDRWFHVGGAPAPDLRVKAFYAYPRVARPGQAQSLVFEVENAGRAASPAYRVEIRDETGVLVEDSLPTLQPREAARRSLITDPDARHPGNFTAILTVDLLDEVGESNERNNLAYATYEIPPHPMPDLTVADLDVTGEMVERKGVRIDVNLTNVGQKYAYRPVVRLMQGDAVLATAVRSVLWPGAGANVSFNVVLPAGSHELRVVADPDRAIAEADEGNNALHVNLTVRPATTPHAMANLLVKELRAMPVDPGPDEPVTLTAFVHNSGEIASNATQVSFYVDGKLLGRKPLPPLRPGSYYNVPFSWGGSSEGDHDLKVLVDPDHAVDESEEGDNVLTSYVALLSPKPKPAPALNESTPDGAAPPSPGADPSAPTSPDPEEPTPPTAPPGGPGPSQPDASKLKISATELVVRTTPVPGGLKGVLVVSLRNPTLEELPRLSVAFSVDGQPLKEILINGLPPAGSASATSGEITLPPGKHVVKAEAKILGTDVRSSTEATYDQAAGERGIPAPSAFVVVACVAVGALLLRRRR